MFNILAHGIPEFELAGARVLDLFAGTGALGLEALSRGAAFCLFVEQEAEARALIRRNVEALGLTGVTKIFRRDATELGPAGRNGGFALAFLDPPYGQGLAERALASAVEGGWLAPGAITVIEERKGTGVALPAGFWASAPGADAPPLGRHAGSLFARFGQRAGHASAPGWAVTEQSSSRFGRPLHYPISGWIEAGFFVLTIAALEHFLCGRAADRRPSGRLNPLCHARVRGGAAGRHRGRARRLAHHAGAAELAGRHRHHRHRGVLLRFARATSGAGVRQPAGAARHPVSLVVGWALFARRPRRLSVLGAGVVLVGIVPLIVVIDGHRAPQRARHRGSLLAFNLRGFAAEFHPWNRRAKTVLEKLRVTGLVVLVTSLASLALTGGFALSIGAGWMPPTELVPTAAQMLHGPTILLGTLVVGALLTAMAALSFSAVVKITTENFMATHAFTPVATLLLQIAASAVGLIPGYALDPGLMPAMGIVIGGVLLMLYAARRR